MPSLGEAVLTLEIPPELRGIVEKYTKYEWGKHGTRCLFGILCFVGEWRCWLSGRHEPCLQVVRTSGANSPVRFTVGCSRCMLALSSTITVTGAPRPGRAGDKATLVIPPVTDAADKVM